MYETFNLIFLRQINQQSIIATYKKCKHCVAGWKLSVVVGTNKAWFPSQDFVDRRHPICASLNREDLKFWLKQTFILCRNDLQRALFYSFMTKYLILLSSSYFVLDK